MKRQLHRAVFEIATGDITERDEDAVVYAANKSLVLNSGVGAVLLEKGGRLVQLEADRKAPVHVGEAVITSAGENRASFIIHAVAPKWGDDAADEKLRHAIFRSLRVADQNGLRSLAMAPLGTGSLGFPPRRAAEILLDTIIRYLNNQSTLTSVVVVAPDAALRDLLIEVAEGMEAAGVLPTVPVPPGELGLVERSGG
jgi:O-acetyl-ADP-ribose deacetylase (regulator of RNase III)